jgi:hypothetical protein
MQVNTQNIRSWLRLIFTGAATIAFVFINSSLAFAQSVEKAETSQQAKQPENALELARAAVAKPGEKPKAPETGKILGDYSVTSSMEVGYRFENTRGNREKYLSDVNVRDGLRVFDYSLDMRSISGQSLLFDALRADVANAGGDQSQYFSLRADKTRVYKFDGTVRQFNFFRALPNFALNQHNFDLRQQVSDFNLKLFPQRPVRINLAYGRSMAKGPFSTTYDIERDEFPITGTMRWEANDYRLGADVTYRRWDFFVEQMYRNFRNDTEYSQPPGTNIGNQTTNFTTLTFFDRDSPARSRALVTRGSLRGNLTSRVHLALRALHGDEKLDITQFETPLGIDSNNRNVLSRSIVTTGRVKRPNNTVDAVLTYDIAEHVSVSESFRYTAYRILGDVTSLDQSVRRPATGPPQALSTSAFDDRLTDLASIWNTVQIQFSLGPKFSANAGWRATHRDVTLRALGSADETETQNTNTFISGLRFRPTKRANFFFDVESGSSDNAFVRINPLDSRRFRVRTNVQATDKLSFNATFVATDRANPTRFVENDSDLRSVSLAAFWQPNARLWLTGGYEYEHLFSTADIAFFINNVLNQGRSRYYARLNFVFTDVRLALTKRLDLLLVYRYVQDRGAPSQLSGATGPNDFITTFPLKRHNPEVRLAYRFSNHFTGNLSYRHYSYNERDRAIEDYRSNILTTSVRWTF